MDIGAVLVDPPRLDENDPPPSVLIVSGSRITAVVLSGIIEKMGLRATCLAPAEAAAVAADNPPPLALVLDCDGTGDESRHIAMTFAARSPRPLMVAVAPTRPDPSLTDLFDRIVARPIVPFAVEQTVAELLIDGRPHSP